METTPVVAQEPVEPEAPLQPPTQPPAQPPAQPPTQPTEPMPTAVEQPSSTTPGGLFSKKAKLSISSRLKSVRDKDKQKMIFLLENDQIWIQNAPRSLPFAKGQEVSIKSGTIGGYLLSNGQGLSTRVSRIK